jgi:transcriptional regulator with XRE-family HTH domain
MTRRGWDALQLARESRLSPATVSAALAGRPIAARSLTLIAEALARTPVIAVIDALVLPDDAGGATLG